MLAISALFFVVTGIQFWASDYLINVLEVPIGYVFPTYAITTATGPVLGAIFGGIVSHKLGGYRTFSTLVFCLIMGLVGCTAAVPAPFTSSFPIFIGLLWIVLFAGGAVMPLITGQMISSVKKKFTANSIASLANNLLGYFPAPFVYGVVCAETGGD